MAYKSNDYTKKEVETSRWERVLHVHLNCNNRSTENTEKYISDDEAVRSNIKYPQTTAILFGFNRKVIRCSTHMLNTVNAKPHHLWQIALPHTVCFFYQYITMTKALILIIYHFSWVFTLAWYRIEGHKCVFEPHNWTGLQDEILSLLYISLPKLFI